MFKLNAPQPPPFIVKVKTRKILIVFTILIISLPAFIFFPNKGTNDMGVWLEWTAHIARWGPLNAYSIINTNNNFQSTDYPPITFINLAIALKVAAFENTSWMIGIKTILLFYFFATWAGIIYLSSIVRGRSMLKSVIVSSSLFLGGLYFVVSSEALSYLDITFAPFVIIALILFERRKYLPSGIFMSLAILVKWIPLLMLPAFLFYFINKRGKRYKIDYLTMFKFFGGSMLTFILLIIIFLWNHIYLVSIIEALRKTFERGSTLSPGAFNFNWIINYIIEQIFPTTYVEFIKNKAYLFQLLSAAIFLPVCVAILKSFLNRKKNLASLLQTSLMISWSYFIWRTSVHENHLFITVLTALCLTVLYTNRSNTHLYLWLCFIGLSNFVVLFGFPVREAFILIPNSFKVFWGIHLTVLLSASHVLIYLVYLRRFLQFDSPSATD